MSNATDALLLVDPYTGRPMDELGTALTWENLAGIALGWVMFLVLEPLVIWVNFAPWIVNPARRPRPTPERYLHACVHSFVAMVVTGGVLFAGFSDLRHHKETTALVKWFGYNNVCIVFDSPPSTYVCPIFWFAVGYLAVRFAHEDTAQRIAPMTHVSEAHKTLAKLANTAFAMVAAFFSMPGRCSMSAPVSLCSHASASAASFASCLVKLSMFSRCTDAINLISCST